MVPLVRFFGNHNSTASRVVIFFIMKEISLEISEITRLSYISLCDCEAICTYGEAAFLICNYSNNYNCNKENHSESNIGN